jgi:uncharacterized protein (TIGR00251 family)
VREVGLLTIKETPEGVTFSVRVLPRSSRSEIIGEAEGVLRVKLTAPPVEGAANKALVELLSDKLKVAKSRITILTGQSGRAKVISVAGLTKADISHLLS